MNLATLDVTCPICKSAPGDKCKDDDAQHREPHWMRAVVAGGSK